MSKGPLFNTLKHLLALLLSYSTERILIRSILQYTCNISIYANLTNKLLMNIISYVETNYVNTICTALTPPTNFPLFIRKELHISIFYFYLIAQLDHI